MKLLPLLSALLLLAACGKPAATGVVSATFLLNGKEQSIPAADLEAATTEVILSNETHTRVFATSSLTPPYDDWKGNVRVKAQPEKQLIEVSYAGKDPDDAKRRTQAILAALASSPVPGQLNGLKGDFVFDIVRDAVAP
jgi:hypothetical protein